MGKSRNLLWLVIVLAALLALTCAGATYGFLSVMVKRRRRRRRLQRSQARRAERYHRMSSSYLTDAYLSVVEIDLIAPEMMYIAEEENEEDGFLDAEKEISANMEACAICLEEVYEGTMIRSLPCTHDFHSECIVMWLKKQQRCPLCNLNMERKSVLGVEL